MRRGRGEGGRSGVLNSGRGVYFDCWHRGGRGGGGTLGDVTHLSGCSRWQSGSHRTREPEWIGSGRPSADARGRVEGAHVGRRCPRGFENTGVISKLTSGNCTSPMKRTPRFSRTMPSEAAKKARTCLMKCFSSLLSLFQCTMSSERSTSSAVREGQGAGESETTVRGKISRIARRGRASTAHASRDG